jgi:hypothetical protein
MSGAILIVRLYGRSDNYALCQQAGLFLGAASATALIFCVTDTPQMDNRDRRCHMRGFVHRHNNPMAAI